MKGYHLCHPPDNEEFVASGCVFLEEEYNSKEFSGSPSHLDEIDDTKTTQPDPPLTSLSHRDELSQDVVINDVI